MATEAFLLIFILLLVMGMPIAFAMVLSSAFFLISSGGIALQMVIQRMTAGINSFPLLAVPLFILAGGLMNTGGITKRLIEFTRAVVGHITGGLGDVVILTNMLMAGICGSAIASAAGTGVMLIPELKKVGYKPAYTAALTASAATLGPIIPPSITMIVYGVASGTPVGKLFIGGVIPGIIITFMLMITNYVMVKKEKIPTENRKSFKEFLQSFVSSLLAIMMPIIVLGSIWGGIVTPTEAAGIAVAYALFLGVVIYKEINLKVFYKVAVNAVLASGKVLFIISAAAIFGWLLTYANVTEILANLLFAITKNPILILLILNVVFLILGCFMETVAVILMTVPILLPILSQIGIDPIHFGVVLTINLMIGTITPPLGVVMFVVTEIAEINVSQFVKSVWPFWIVLIICLLILTFIPQLVLWLPQSLL